MGWKGQRTGGSSYCFRSLERSFFCARTALEKFYHHDRHRHHRHDRHYHNHQKTESFFFYIHLVVRFNTEKVFLWFHINAFFSWLCKLKLRHRFRWMFGLQFINSQNYSPSYNFAPGYRNPHKISESLFTMTSLSNIHISIWRANKIWRALSNWKIQFHVIGQYLFRITWYSLQLLSIKAGRERGVGNWPHWLYRTWNI